MENNVVLYWLKTNLVDKDIIDSIRGKLRDSIQNALSSCYFMTQTEFENYIQEHKMSSCCLDFLKSERKRFSEIGEDDGDRRYSRKELFQRSIFSLQGTIS